MVFDRLRLNVRDRCPSLYYFIVRFLSVVFALLRYRTFFLNGKKAHWFLRERKGTEYLYAFWTPLNSIDAPLRLPLQNVNQVNFADYVESGGLNLNHFNPCIVTNEKSIQICWRISDVFFHPATKSNGDSLINPTVGVCNGIGIATIERNDLFNQARLKNSKILIEPTESKRNTVHKLQDAYGRFLDFEDPRFIPDYPHLILLHGRYTGEAPDKFAPRYDIGLFNLNTSEIKLLIPKNRHRAEKNWVPIRTDDRNHLLLRSTKPFAILALGKEDYRLSEHSWDSGDFGEIHNGSNFLRLSEDLYIRVVRETINLDRLRGVRINFIMMHDLELKEIGRTKPFLFHDFGYEICNSVTEFEDKIFFAWGMNDSAGYIGNIDRADLANWIRIHTITSKVS